MKVLMINVVCGIRSTGRICTDLAAALEAQGHEVKIAYGRENVPSSYEKYAVRIGSDVDVKLHGLRARLSDGCGYGSIHATRRFLEWVRKYDPDVIHLHNIHGYYINVKLLFDYLRTCKKKIIWTLHDCWAFTGHAAYCEAAGCERWIAGCYDCPKLGDYPSSFIDRSAINWKKKREIFTEIPNLSIVTPSCWLSNLVKKSFLSDYPVKVVYNGINTEIFHPTKSDVKERLGLSEKRIALGVAALWEERKGLKDFEKLAECLDDSYQIVLVGLSKAQIKMLPDGIVGIVRTNSPQELAELYSAADVFINPTYEDNYPTTNLEAIACGTPVITYASGGSPEGASLFGCAVEKGDVDALVEQIKNSTQFVKQNYDLSSERTIQEYLRLYSIST